MGDFSSVAIIRYANILRGNAPSVGVAFYARVTMSIVVQMKVVLSLQITAQVVEMDILLDDKAAGVDTFSDAPTTQIADT